MARHLFCTDTDAGTITVLDADSPSFDKIKAITVGNDPRGAVRFTDQGIGYVSNHAGNTISEIDTKSLTEIGRIIVGIAPIGLAILPGDRFAIVSNGGEDTLSIVDLTARADIGKVQVGREPRHPDVTPDGRFAYVPISAQHHIAKIDLGALASTTVDPSQVNEIAKIDLGVGTFPYSVGISPNGALAVAANNQAKYISIIDLKTDTVIAQVDVGFKGARGSAFTPDSKFAFVSLENTSEIVVIDLKSFSVVKRMDAASGPRGLLYDPRLNILASSAFDRAMAARSGNAVSVFSFGPSISTLVTASPPPLDIRVDAGPCSVSIYPK